MKYLCPSCERLVSPAHVELHDARIEITCPKCGEREQVILHEEPLGSQDHSELGADPAPEQKARGDNHQEVAAKEGCPKCGTPRTGGDACPRCGLVYERWSHDKKDAPPPSLTKLWQKVEQRWDEESLHARFVKEAFDSDSLAYAARCYRAHDDDVARKQLDALTTLGVQAMRSAEQPSAVTPKIARTIGWVLFVLLCLTLVTLALLAVR